MKPICTLIVLCLLFSACQKELFFEAEKGMEVEVDKTKIYGKWKFVSATRGGIFYSNTDSCLADNWIEFRTGGTGTISYGTCIENPLIHASGDFPWKFKDTANIDFGDNEIRLIKLNDSVLEFKVLSTSAGPSNDEFRWKR